MVAVGWQLTALMVPPETLAHATRLLNHEFSKFTSHALNDTREQAVYPVDADVPVKCDTEKLQQSERVNKQQRVSYKQSTAPA